MAHFTEIGVHRLSPGLVGELQSPRSGSSLSPAPGTPSSGTLGFAGGRRGEYLPMKGGADGTPRGETPVGGGLTNIWLPPDTRSIRHRSSESAGVHWGPAVTPVTFRGGISDSPGLEPRQDPHEAWLRPVS